MAKKVAPITTQNKKTMKTIRSKAVAKRATTTTIQDEKTIKTVIPKPLNPNYVTKIKIKFFQESSLVPILLSNQELDLVPIPWI
jgi:hypothetical protein